MTLPLLDVSSTMFFLRVSITVVLTLCVVFAKIYQRCDLVRELRNFDVPSYEIPTWVCIVQHESNYNSSAMNPASGDHGLFQISQLYWCSPPGHGYGCNSPCSKFRDDDISDDVQCIRRIYNEHKRISGNGFNAWTVYPLYCKDDLSRYMSNCSEPDVPSQNNTENEVPNGEDLDEYGYHFPALPSFPKEQEEENNDGQVFLQLPFNKHSINDSIPVKDAKVRDLFNSSKSLIKDEKLKLPYSKVSIHHSVPVTETHHVLFEKLPYSKQSIHHSTAVMSEKVLNDANVENILLTAIDGANTKIDDNRKQEEPARFNANPTVSFDVGIGPKSSETNTKTLPIALEFKNSNDNVKKLLGETSKASTNLSEKSATDFKKQPIASSNSLNISYNSKILLPLDPTMLPLNIQRRMLDLTQFTETSFTKNATTNSWNFLTSTFPPPSTTRESISTTNPNARQLTFAPDSFFSWLFNSQTLPPILPPVRPSRPPGERPGNPNRPTTFRPVGEGSPGRPRPTAPRPVRPGGPVLVSFPHLLHSDLRYVKSVEGLKPNTSKHEMFVTLEPVSGTPLKLAKRIQFNIILRPIEGITSLQNVVHSLVPLFWIEESTTLPEKYQQVIVNTLYRTLFIINVIKYSILAVAVAIIACCCLLFFILT